MSSTRYAPFIQDYIYQTGWQALRSVQNAAAEAIFNTDDNVLLTASTASGKTEAAFFPILTLMDEDPPHSVGVLYIAPLKALINDQFGRLSRAVRGSRDPGDALAWGCVSRPEAKAAAQAFRHFADHAGVAGVADDQQAYGDPFAVWRSALHRHRRGPFAAAGRSGHADVLSDRALCRLAECRPQAHRSVGDDRQS